MSPFLSLPPPPLTMKAGAWTGRQRSAPSVGGHRPRACHGAGGPPGPREEDPGRRTRVLDVGPGASRPPPAPAQRLQVQRPATVWVSSSPRLAQPAGGCELQLTSSQRLLCMGPAVARGRLMAERIDHAASTSKLGSTTKKAHFSSRVPKQVAIPNRAPSSGPISPPPRVLQP